MSSNQSVTTSGSTSKEVRSSSTQEQRSSTTQQTAHRTQMSRSTGSESIERSSKNVGGNASMTTTTTIYDADGNVVKTITNVDDQTIPGDQTRSLLYTNTSTDNRRANTISDKTANDNQNIRRIEIQQDHTNRSHSPTESQADSVATTYYVDENYVDTNKMRNKNASSDFKSFYGHGRDSSNTVVGNTYDSNAVQNTIGTRGRVIMDHNIDTTDVVFSNDRNYGKTGWNGQFTDEEPPIRKVVETPKQKSWERPRRGKGKLRPEDLPAAGLPSVRR